MIVQGIIEVLITQGFIALARTRGYSRLVVFAGLKRSQRTRVSFASLLRIRRGNTYLLIRSKRRPEQFGPIGGVNKYYSEAEPFLDKLEFVPQVVSAEMEQDLRGFLPARHLPRLVRWYDRREGCETIEACLRRELHEELAEIGLGELALPETLCFRSVRLVWEGPRRVPGEFYKQFRIFHVCGMRIEDNPSKIFSDRLWDEEATNPHLVIASADQIIRGRTQNGSLLGALSEYMFHSRLSRPDSPAFVTPHESSPRNRCGNA